MFVHERSVAFHEVDAAGLVFFPWFLVWAHDAMDAFFSGLPGGYVGLITERRVGLPAVAVQSEFKRPVRYGDRMRVEVTTARLGNRSLTLRYQFFRGSPGELCAEVLHTVVATDLERLVSVDMPEDVRRVAREHLAEERAD